MCRLSFLILLLLFCRISFSQSPHGKKLKISCEECHTNDSWKINLNNLKFDHNKTNFKLSGQHQKINCRQCHQSLDFTKGEMDCRSCHTDMHNGTVGFDCARCHSTQNWLVANVRQLHRSTRFPLLGAHAAADCYSCHKSGSLLQFEPLGVACYDCHKTNYELTKSPPHRATGYSADCQQCHKMTANEWSASGINHNFFPLTGGHAISCAQCHTQGSFGNLSKACYSCHADQYKATKNPPHNASQFPLTCENCHTINGWSPAKFDHNSTNFPLTGAHAKTACADCHSSGYTGTPITCNSCHLPQYNATSNPLHTIAKFPLTCESCHNTNAWTPSTFNHDGMYFPIYSGRHRGALNLCTDCHTDAANYSIFSCINCHEHDKTSTDRHHNGRTGYTYTPTSCYTCHPRGNGD
jgi:hypothetical protein